MTACQAEVQLQIGRFEAVWPVLVAPITEEVLLGLDLLREADVEISARGSVYVQGHQVESQTITKGVGYLSSPVQLERDLLLRPNTEHITWAVVERPSAEKEGLLTPAQLSAEEVLVASALVHMEARVPVRLANFADHEIKLRARQLLGDLVEAQPTGENPRQEPQKELDPPTISSASQAQGLDPLELPSHLHHLYQRALSELNANAAKKLAQVLYKVQGKRGARVLHHNQLKPYRSPDVPHWVSRFQAILESKTTQAQTELEGEGVPAATELGNEVARTRDQN